MTTPTSTPSSSDLGFLRPWRSPRHRPPKRLRTPGRPASNAANRPHQHRRPPTNTPTRSPRDTPNPRNYRGFTVSPDRSSGHFKRAAPGACNTAGQQARSGVKRKRSTRSAELVLGNDGERLGADGGPNGRDARRRSEGVASAWLDPAAETVVSRLNQKSGIRGRNGDEAGVPLELRARSSRRRPEDGRRCSYWARRREASRRYGSAPNASPLEGTGVILGNLPGGERVARGEGSGAVSTRRERVYERDTANAVTLFV